MLRILLITILPLGLFSGGHSVEFKVQKFLKNAEDLAPENRSSIFVTENCSYESNVTVRAEIPLLLINRTEHPDIKIFFANDKREILMISLNEIVRGTFFSLPYQMEKTMTGAEVHRSVTERIIIVVAEFTNQWLPKNCNKTSASIRDADGNIYNYYGVRNFDISVPDVMVVEEYLDYNCDDPGKSNH